MDRVFSVEEELWGSAVSPKMNRSSSEWAFQRFLLESTSSPADVVKKDDDEEQEVVVEIKDKQAINDNNNNNNNSSTNNNDVNGNMSHTMVGGPSPNVPCDSEEYQAFLKSRLNLACAAVALSRASQVKPQDATTLTETGTKTSNASQMVSQAVQKGPGLDSSKAQDKDGGEPVGIPSLPSMQNKSAVQVRSATSGSSRDLSDDDELDGAETTENMNPADAKRVRRMLSNRESARRSRRRKQAHLSELETQVAQLRVENSSLLKRLTDISQKYSEATVDNRVLKADIETMRAKVKMAEGTVKRVTGLNPMFQVMSDMPSISMPSYDGSPSDTSADAAVPVQDVAQNHFHHPVSKYPSPPNDPRVSNGSVSASSVENVHLNHPPAMASGNKMERTPSMQRVASLEHLQKRIRGGVNSSGEH